MALRTPRGSPVWEPKDSVFVNARLEPLFGWIGLLGAVVATAVSGYLFMAQLGAANETITAMGLSVGDWMTVASVMVGLVAWGYRKAETPFGKKVIAILSKATRIGLLCICAIGAIFAVLQSASLSRRFITTAPQAIWDSTEYIGRLQQGFTVPMLLAAAALLLAAHLMTLQFWEAGEALRQQSEASSVFRPDIQELIDFLAVHANGYERARLDERFPESEPILAQLHSIGLVVQVRKRPRLTSQGKRVATSNITGT
ncbi:hypothetical protein PP621_24800, partial [Mycobacteroides abscessus]|nr:hypothetical protein [Mycobacteroides abscessus]MDM2637440.1 hypothetical protein [Mycobacteroides abscessus]